MIAGAGVGGLVAATAFAQRGHELLVLERAPELRDGGGGFQITPNGARVLHALGLEPALRDVSVTSQGVRAFDGRGGRQLFHMPIRGDIPYRFISRARLARVLADAALAAGAEIRFDAGVRAVTPEGCAEMLDGSTLQADLVVGAEGLHSKSRERLNSPGTPFFTGNVAWRAIVPMDLPAASHLWLLPHRHVVCYPLGPGETNLVAVREQDAWASEGWHHRDAPEVLQAAFSDACDELLEIFSKVEEVHLWGLFRHVVAPVWQQGRAALVGDAVHPTVPFLAQGANMAIEDGWALADEVCRADDDMSAALGRYQDRRKGRATRVVEASTGQAAPYHLKGVQRLIGHSALRLSGSLAPRIMASRMSWIYDHDETAPRI
ncbi:FAD-dependent monooxygenase [Pseudoroseicyclus sp. H15]